LGLDLERDSRSAGLADLEGGDLARRGLADPEGLTGLLDSDRDEDPERDLDLDFDFDRDLDFDLDRDLDLVFDFDLDLDFDLEGDIDLDFLESFLGLPDLERLADRET
jgi:hypothetical protein